MDGAIPEEENAQPEYEPKDLLDEPDDSEHSHTPHQTNPSETPLGERDEHGGDGEGHHEEGGEHVEHGEHDGEHAGEEHGELIDGEQQDHHQQGEEGEQQMVEGEYQERVEGGEEGAVGEHEVHGEHEQHETTLDESTANEDETSSENKEHSEADRTVANVSPSSGRHKDVKRRKQRKQLDNMIAEEDDHEEGGDGTRSPGPPLEGISQNLDDGEKYQAIHDREFIQPSTPDRMKQILNVDDDQEQIIEEEEIKLSREEIIARYHAVMEEKERLQNVNNQLHHKLADYFRKRKTDDAQGQQMFDKSSQDQEQRYTKYLNTIDDMHKEMEIQREKFEEERDILKYQSEKQQILVQEERGKYIKLKRDIALKSVSTNTGKGIPPKEIEGYLLKEQQKEQEVIQVRLEYIKLKNQLKKRETQLKAKEELGEGLHLIDFEQLKIENQTYNEKIEERNEELMKLKKKINNTVQILTHVKEKLKFVSVENEKEKDSLSIYDEEVKKKRDTLNHIKQSRDSLRLNNNSLKQNSGLLGNTMLLRDYEDSVDNNERLGSKIEQLKRKHAELTLDSKGLKNKIAQVKADK